MCCDKNFLLWILHSPRSLIILINVGNLSWLLKYFLNKLSDHPYLHCNDFQIKFIWTTVVFRNHCLYKTQKKNLFHYIWSKILSFTCSLPLVLTFTKLSNVTSANDYLANVRCMRHTRRHCSDTTVHCSLTCIHPVTKSMVSFLPLKKAGGIHTQHHPFIIQSLYLLKLDLFI